MFFERIHNIFNWGDKLTRYNGETITYDEIGNPLSYRDGMEMTWLNGRKLTTLQSGNDSISYKYDSNGVITSKTVNGVEYTYEYLNGHLMHETRGEKVFDYCYDANGQLYAVSYKANSSTDAVTYYYAHNWRGDITSIYDGDGNMVAKYEYDAWGNVLTVTNSNNSEITDPNHIANLNPFRYRSYYYDSESGFYYLMSRYYDPVTHRFLNADGYFQSGDGILDTNMNAYCRNNPLNNIDKYGTLVTTIGLNVFGCFGVPACFSIYMAVDDYGNYGFYYSYCDYQESGGVGIMSISATTSLNIIWDAETIDDLDKSYQYWGGSFGEVFSIGADAILLEEYETLSGLSFSFGISAGIDWVHGYTTTNQTIFKSNDNPTSNSKNNIKSNTNNKSNTVNQNSHKVRCCTACGRPDYICPSPVYY